MSLSRPWLALVLALFCLPLFIGLGRADFEIDEAIYSFAVDRILETGDWLEPKSIPNETWAFLEKPPLKFWIVAAPIRLGVLPHDEFGIRFWDALFGALAFVYVFADWIAARSAGLRRRRRSRAVRARPPAVRSRPAQQQHGGRAVAGLLRRDVSFFAWTCVQTQGGAHRPCARGRPVLRAWAS